MSDRAVGVIAILIAGAHVAVFAVAWRWAHRSRHNAFLLLLCPVALSWAAWGHHMVIVLTYGTRPFRAPRNGLQTAGFVAIVLGFAGLAVCAVGAWWGVYRQGRLRDRVT
jgi:hypothetical protein